MLKARWRVSTCLLIILNALLRTHSHAGTNFQFNTPQLGSAGPWPNGIVAADFDRDGNLDIAVANAVYSGSITIMRGLGDGSFLQKTNYRVGMYPESILYNNPPEGGTPKIVTVVNDPALSVLLQSTNGTFTNTSTIVPLNPRKAYAARFDGDDIPDLLIRHLFGGITVLLGSSNGLFTQVTNYSLVPFIEAIGIGDFDQDGRNDLITASSGGGQMFFAEGLGDGTFMAPTRSPTTGDLCVATADFNRDGRLDMATGQFPGTLNIYWGTGVSSNLFTPSQRFPVQSPLELICEDFDGDSVIDIATIGGSGNVSLFRGKGDGRFFPADTFELGLLTVSGAAAGDFNNDGRIDLIGSSEHYDVISILLNRTSARLSVTHSENGVVVSWPNDPVSLEAIAALGATNWSLVTEPTTVIGNRRFLTNSAAKQREFFRLRF